MFQAGQKFGSYKLIKKIGKGGFGEVWLAEKRSEFVKKRVAVKLPHDGLVDFEEIRQEATLWEQASGHPNVLPLIDADVFDGQVAIVSEFASGGSLAERLKTQGKFPAREAVEMTLGILNGLDYLHSKRIIHRDIKPANILLQNDTPRLADFGISRAVETSTISSVVVGTENYMAPEAFEGKRNIQTDIWSVGVLLYQLLKGSLPFPQKNASEVMYAVLLKEPEPLPDDIPPKLQEIVFKALAKDRELGEELPKRYQTAAEMREDLKTFLESLYQPIGTTKETMPALPTTESEVETKVKTKIPVQTREGWKTVQQKFVKNKVSPLVILSLFIGFVGIVSLALYFFSRTPASNSDSANTAVYSSANSISNSVDETNSNSVNTEAAAKALEYVNQGYKFYQQKKYNQAIEAYTKAVEINPNDYALYNDRGLIYTAKRDYDKAITDFDKSIELKPDSLTYNNRGVAYEDKGEKEKAVEDYRKAVELDPANEQAQQNLNKIFNR
jgi:serine/threonine-protein kinase